MTTNSALPSLVSVAAPSAGARPQQSKQLPAQANEFEAMLLTQWLQNSASTFGSAPGEDDSGSAGDDQIRSFALQQLASGIAAKGGIGIARYVSAALASTQPDTAPSTNGLPAGLGGSK